MLTTSEIQAELARVTYRQGWTFSIYQDDWEGPHLLVTAPVPNAYQPGQTITLGIRSPLPPIPDADYLHLWLAWRLGRIESHESREMLRIDGIAPFDPHA
ncbi:MAG: hypothetical protein JWO67_739 [Streptosporangiaceae bacterium]|nr:hypothetical protein [Streptosporangiaceae bacterium]